MTATPTPDADALADGLSDLERSMLDLESRTFWHVGSKERAVREVTGMRVATYLVHLSRLIDRPEALRYAPAVVNRLRARRVSARGPDEEGGDGDGTDDMRLV